MSEARKLVSKYGAKPTARALAYMLASMVKRSGAAHEKAAAKRALAGYVRAVSTGVTPGMLELWFRQAEVLDAKQRKLAAVRGEVGFEPLEIWTPAAALARVEQIDTKVSMLDKDVAKSKVDPDFVTQWALWRSKWQGYAADMRDSWFSRGFSSTAHQLDAFERELDVWRTRFKAIGGTVHGAELNQQTSKPDGPLDDVKPGSGFAMLAVGALAGFAALKLLQSKKG